jgi:hypothetical protein
MEPKDAWPMKTAICPKKARCNRPDKLLVCARALSLGLEWET